MVQTTGSFPALFDGRKKPKPKKGKGK